MWKHLQVFLSSRTALCVCVCVCVCVCELILKEKRKKKAKQEASRDIYIYRNNYSLWQIRTGDVYLLVRGSSLMKISMLSALSVWGKSTRFEGECKPCDILSFKALRTRLAFFKSSWGSRVYGGRNRGAAATKHTVSYWVRDAIALAYEARGQASPLRVRAHSTRGVASSMALARGAPLQLPHICSLVQTL